MGDYPHSQHQPNKPRATPLRPLALDSSPFETHALAWSPDAELAIATDDSVHVFIPRLIGLDGNAIPILEADDDVNGGADIADDATNGGSNGPGTGNFTTETASRGQFTTHNRQIPIGTCTVQKGINSRLHALPTGIVDMFPQAQSLPRDAYEQDKEPDMDTEGRLIIGTSKSTMHSVVSVAWSPSGVGRHGRSVLGILTAAGTLLIYGECLDDGDEAAGGTSGSSTTGPGRRNYDTSQWELLWGAGHRALVGGQKSSDRIVSFSWASKWEGPGYVDELDNGLDQPAEINLRALLVYTTDLGDIVVLSVFHYHSEGGRVAWAVMETSRRKVAGPQVSADPVAATDWSTRCTEPSSSLVAAGKPRRVSSFGMALQCSSWLETLDDEPNWGREHFKTCLVGYISGNYVGFRRITVQASFTARIDGAEDAYQFAYLDHHDIAGYCMDLLPNAFIKFEDGVWAVAKEDGGAGHHAAKDEAKRKRKRNGADSTPRSTGTKTKFICRAMVATPLVIKALELEVEVRDPTEPEGEMKPPQVIHTHDSAAATSQFSSVLNSTIPENLDEQTNPITGLVIHPPDPKNRGAEPFYTLVRQCATATDQEWYETNLSVMEGTPQWVDEIGDLIGSSPLAESAHVVNNTSRVRFWGLGKTPGGLPGHRGVTAVLISHYGYKSGARGTGRHNRGRQSRVLFAWQDTLPAAFIPAPASEPGGVVSTRTSPAAAGATSTTYYHPHVSTEAKMWTHVYGAGPPVVAQPAIRQQWSPAVAGLIHGLSPQECIICQQPITGSDSVTSICTRRHTFSRCSATGLAILWPNVSHACGVCGGRTLNLNQLLEMIRQRQSQSQGPVEKKDVFAIRQEVLGEVCKRCGGKFYD